MSLVLDAGALIAYDRGSKTVQAFLAQAHGAGVAVRTTTGVVAQVWREPVRQARIASILNGVEEVPLTSSRARGVGFLLGRTGSPDVVDAALAEMLRNGDEVLTSDPCDIAALADAAGKAVIVTPV